MIVAVLGLAALTLVRIQRMQIEGGNDMRKAQLYAKAAVDMAWHRIQNDSSWRSKMASGTWSTDQVIGDGYYSFTATDPIDGNLTNSAVHPVVIVGVGKSGTATQKVQMEIRVLQPGIRCLESVVHADNTLTFDGGTVTSDRIVSANNSAQVTNNAQAYTDAEAATGIVTSSGGVWYGTTTTSGAWPREMPNTASLYSYYTTNGTTINYNNLPFWDANLIDNPGAEASVLTSSPWYAVSCTGSVNLLIKKSGLQSFYISGRNSTDDFLAQDVTSKLQSGVAYYTEAYVRGGSNQNDHFTVKLKVVSTGTGTQYFDLTNTDAPSANFKMLSGTQTISWTGSLTQAELYVFCDNPSESYYVDEVIMRVHNAPSNTKVIHRKVLSPASNPFGATNSRGIYVINCGGNKISIRNSRIVGTLILLNQDEGGSEIAGSIHWAPAVISADPMVASMPSLLSNKRINLSCTSVALDEGLVNANFNSSGTPYNDSQDSDRSDRYPSIINGVVYTESDIVIANSPTIMGVLVGDNNITATNATLTLKYDPLYFERNAPPGFQAAVTYFVMPGSYRQVVD